MSRIVSKPYEIIQVYGGDPKWFGGIRGMHGGWYYYLVKKYGESIPNGLVLGKTFKLQHKGVTFFGKVYPFPFDLDEFEWDYQNKLKMI
jgi:hypothetical protein